MYIVYNKPDKAFEVQSEEKVETDLNENTPIVSLPNSKSCVGSLLPLLSCVRGELSTFYSVFLSSDVQIRIF